MWYNRPKQYLRKTFSQSGLGVLLMAKKPDNTFEACQMDANGAIKVDATITGGDATAANQTTQITEAQTANTLLTTISTNTASGGVLTDTSYSVVSTSSDTALPSGASKKVTLINPSTNTAAMEVAVGSGGVVLPLEVGYSLVANVSNANRITVKQTGGEAETMYYIISN
jgi:hypothetical protein